MENPRKEVIPIIHLLTTAPPHIQQATLEKYFTRNASFTHPFCRTGSFLSLIDLYDYFSGSGAAYDQQRQGGIDSRWVMLQIYRWYKVLSPRIDIYVDSVAWDKDAPSRGGQSDSKALTRGRNHGGAEGNEGTAVLAGARNETADAGLVYVSIRQKFRIWAFIPLGYEADVRLVTVLSLTSSNAYHSDGDALPTENENETENENDGGGNNTKYYITHQEDLYQTNEWIKFLVPWGLGSLSVILWQFFATVQCVIGALLLGPFTAILEQWFGGDAEKGVGQNDKVKSG